MCVLLSNNTHMHAHISRNAVKCRVDTVCNRWRLYIPFTRRENISNNVCILNILFSET